MRQLVFARARVLRGDAPQGNHVLLLDVALRNRHETLLSTGVPVLETAKQAGGGLVVSDQVYAFTMISVPGMARPPPQPAGRRAASRPVDRAQATKDTFITEQHAARSDGRRRPAGRRAPESCATAASSSSSPAGPASSPPSLPTASRPKRITVSRRPKRRCPARPSLAAAGAGAKDSVKNFLKPRGEF